MKVAILGAGGIIGQHLRLCAPAGIEPIWTRRKPDLLHLGLDITDTDALYAFLDEHAPEVVINLSGENRPDVVERGPNAYHAVNCIAPARIAHWCLQHQAHYIHVSTQGVFGNPSAPSDIPWHPMSTRKPVNAYGQQKVEAENVVRAINPDTTIVRPTFVLGVRPMPLVGRQNPVEHWLSPPKLCLESETVGKFREVNNRWFSVSFAWDVAAALWDVLQMHVPVMHVGIPYRVSRYDLAKYLREDVEAVNHEDFPGIANRPIDTTYAGEGSWETIEDGLEICRLAYESREKMGIGQRGREIAIFGCADALTCHTKLASGFGPLHAEVTADFKRANPQTDAELLEWYRKTDSYIWELTAYHLIPEANYSGMCGGIAEALKAKGCERVLCLGDGIGDLTITLRKAGIDALYHDLADSRTERFAMMRQQMYLGCTYLCSTQGWNPDDIWWGGDLDAIVSLDFLEHVPNCEEWLRAIYAALKPGGWFCAQNGFAIGSGPEGSMPMHLACNDHWEKDYDPFLASLGFRQESSNWYQKI